MQSPLRPVVLLVEDELFVRMATADALMDAGFDVIETANAQAAHEVLLHRADIQVLFTDVKMPGSMDGLELASLVRRRWPHILVVITSGHLEPESGSPAGRGRLHRQALWRKGSRAMVIQSLLA